MTTATDPTVTNALYTAATRAALAPSIHNTQPWHFTVTGRSLEIRSDSSRQLTVLDPRRRQLTISCGCALFNARVSIAADGFDPVVERFPDPGRPDLIARISLGNAIDWMPIGALDSAIGQRRTNRRAFADERVPASVIYDLIQAARSENGELIPITNPEHRRAAAELSQVANQVQQADAAYLTELLAWTTDDPTRLDGVQALSVPYAGALSDAHDRLPLRPFDVRGAGWLPASSNSDADHCLLLFATAQDRPASWLRAGEALEHVWLTLTRLGYAASPLTQVVEVARTRPLLRTALGIEAYPQLLLRVGLAPSAERTRRRHHADVIHASTSPAQPPSSRN
jgi:nitroreductase